MRLHQHHGVDLLVSDDVLDAVFILGLTLAVHEQYVGELLVYILVIYHPVDVVLWFLHGFYFFKHYFLGFVLVDEVGLLEL